MELKKIIPTDENIEFKRIVLNSKEVEKGDLFIPFGGVLDRNNYVDEAISNGASGIISDKKIISSIPNLQVKDLDKEIITFFNKYYDYPLKDINLIGITGTEGKTTVASILSCMLSCPNIGTNGFFINSKMYSLKNTTPSLDILYNCFEKAKISNYKNIVMEVSSEAYLNNRIGKLPFQVGIFLNISKEHLDKHKTLKNYLNCKLKLIDNSRIIILNKDMKYLSKVKRYVKKHSKAYYTYGFKKKSDLNIVSYQLFLDRTEITFLYKEKKYMIKTNLLGKFNVSNIACCILTLLKLGLSIEEIKERLTLIKPVLGRMETLYDKDFRIVIDYAHTTNATYEVLNFYSNFYKNIITVVGAAGGRYKEKRKKIGALVLKYSKMVIFTMDDPRTEDPNVIIKDMLNDTKKRNYKIIINRKQAIKYALNIAKKEELVLVLGKGRDDYMAIYDKKVKYSDYDTIMNFLKLRK